MSNTESEQLSREHDHIDFRNEVRGLVQDAIRSEREHPSVIVQTRDGFNLVLTRAVVQAMYDRENQTHEHQPIPMILTCPACSARHIDEGVFATKVHHTHSCQKCGLTWRPAVVPTVGVQFLPGFKNNT